MSLKIGVVIAVLISALTSINAIRASYDLPALAVDNAATAYAAAWSQQMAETGVLTHSPNLTSATTGWTRLGENVGTGPSVDAVLTAFMQSSAHSANMLGEWTHVGVGVVELDGAVWVTVVFVLRQTVATTTITTIVTTTTITTTTAAQTTLVLVPTPALTPAYVFVQLPPLCKNDLTRRLCLW